MNKSTGKSQCFFDLCSPNRLKFKMEAKPPVFEKIYRDYLNQLNTINLQETAYRMGSKIEGDSVIIPFFDKQYKISTKGIVDQLGKEPIHSIKVVLCKYLLLYPNFKPRGNDWVSYRDFKDSAPFVTGFQNNSEMAIAKNFANRIEEMKMACLKLGGYSPEIEVNYQLSMKFDALPDVPVLLLFNDTDSEFTARCLILFEQRAEKYLDMECLAIIGWFLSDYLISFLHEKRSTIM
ncbi:MAG: DUF3786 domain-containing protein [Thermodesulfobacteriota bacterium]|nr:DUF3786 domain-containing protein [Thermodesulfobacteriota bacterium]